MSHSLAVLFDNLELLPPSLPHLYRHWASDHYCVSHCARVLNRIRAGASIVPGFEANSHGDASTP